MLIQDVWVLTMKKDGKYLICNMKWLAEHRAFGVVAFKEVATPLKNIDYEIKWSDGNMKWVDSIEGLAVINFTDITSKENNWDSGKTAIHTSTAAISIVKTKSGITAVHDWYAGRGIYINDREDEVNKLNNRLSIIGSKDNYCTDGVDIKLWTYEQPKRVDPYKIYLEDGDHVLIEDDSSIDVTNWDFLDLAMSYDYEDIEITAKGNKKLRYLQLNYEEYALNKWRSAPHKVRIGDNIDIESALDVQILDKNVKRFKRLYDCTAGLYSQYSRKEITLDLSNTDYIGYRGLVAGYYMERVTLDFKDKYVVLCKDAIYITEHGKKHNQKVTIRYSNPEMHEQMEVYKRDDNFTVEYYGE